MRRAGYQRAFLATVVLYLIWQVEASDGSVKITHDGPVVLGGTITFRADLFDSDGKVPSGKFMYTWTDNAIHQNSYATGTTSNTTTFYTLSYPEDIYYVGLYVMEVTVCKWRFLNIVCEEYTSNRIEFLITRLLNGEVAIAQSNKTVSNKFVSSAEVAKLSVNLRKGDLDYINKTATSIDTYWFIDCKPVNNSNGFKLDYNFTNPLSFHTIEALVVVSHDPPITTTVAPSTTTTTVSPNGTTTLPSNVTVSSTTTPSVPTSTNSTIPSTTSNFSDPTKSNTTVPPLGNHTLPYICKSNVSRVLNKTYGYFQREVNVRAPISKLNIEGATWIQPWNSLSLTVTCNGTGPFNKCIEIHTGKYNITGNETCNQNFEKLDVCKFTLTHYFLDPLEYTVLIILSNDVSTEIHPVAINIYKFTPKPQLSVIIVPVSCSLVAVVLIVFGIAYYVQNRSRFTIEVADFDFGQRNADMEYKTFTERLRDSFNNAGYKQLDNAKDTQSQGTQ